MNYLSFDIECCDGSHICEFGYVLVDDFFNVLDRDCITINPEHDFILTGRYHESDIKLAFSEEEYNGSPKFDFYYEKIKSLLNMPNTRIIGFSAQNDVRFLDTACSIYEKEKLSFLYYDFQGLYRGYTKSQSITSVGKIVERLGIEDIRLHKSDDDAFAVIKALQYIANKEGKNSLTETLNFLVKAKSTYKTERTIEKYSELIEKIKQNNKSARNDFIKIFTKNLTVSREKKDNVFFGKKVSTSVSIENDDFNAFLSLLEILYRHGASYTNKSSLCDVFICGKRNNNNDKRLSIVKQTIKDEGRNILVLSLDDALKSLSVVYDDLTKINHLDITTNDADDK